MARESRPTGFTLRVEQEYVPLPHYIAAIGFPLGHLCFDGHNSIPVVPADFDLIKDLGHGGFGFVRHVRHRGTGADVAVKVIEDTSEKARQQLVQDLQVVARARSPFIVECYGAAVQNNELHIFMQLMWTSFDNVILRAKETGTHFTPEAVLVCLTHSMVSGLLYLYTELRCLHRDVKPHNVLLGFHGEIKLCDFGIAKTLAHTKTRSASGCFTYMAPERFDPLNEEGLYGVKSDVWSLGMTLHEIAHLQYPYETVMDPAERQRLSMFTLASVIVRQCPPPAMSPPFSKEFVHFLQCCLQTEPDRRLSYEQLLEHPFVAARAAYGPQHVAEWVTSFLPLPADVPALPAK
eukprot:m.485210 g.485210  ORF g.485210 m.485210 type:complete len:349 (+) comp23703_c0_seq1:329-1375(+)